MRVSACQGVFLVSAKNAFVAVKRDNCVNTYLRISTVLKIFPHESQIFTINSRFKKNDQERI